MLAGDSGSHVSGSIIGGVFQGVITTSSGDVYHVERKAYHAPHPLTERDEVHSVLYREADVDMDKFHQYVLFFLLSHTKEFSSLILYYHMSLYSPCMTLCSTEYYMHGETMYVLE